MTTIKLQAGAPFPTVNVAAFGGDSIELGKPRADHDWKLVVVYRGKHCPLCTRYLESLNQALPALSELGVDVAAVSADSANRAAEHLTPLNLQFPVGYDLSIDQMNALGLYISDARSGIGAERPFAEPGLFVVNEDGNLQMVGISNVPFARPSIDSMLMGLKFVRNREGEFPVNGSYA